MNMRPVRTPDTPPSWDALAGSAIDVPGSTSNLGPGFDALGLALRLSLRLQVTSVVDDGRGETSWSFGGIRLEGDNAIERGYRAGLQAFLGGEAQVPSLHVTVGSDIPMRAGLGSSAAALVAGLRLAERLAGAQSTDRLLSLACQLEGHPDNTSASILGGFAVAAVLDDCSVVARALRWPERWHIVVATPNQGLETKVARAALPTSVPLADAVFNIQRTATLVAAVQNEDDAAMRAALTDRLHQPHRARLVPGLGEALTWACDGLIGAFLSGAGPSIAAIVDASTRDATAEIGARFDRLYAELGLSATIRTLEAQPPLPPAR